MSEKSAYIGTGDPNLRVFGFPSDAYVEDVSNRLWRKTAFTVGTDRWIEVTPASTNNATVPANSGILPPQAFVDSALAFNVNYADQATLELNSKGIVYFDATTLLDSFLQTCDTFTQDPVLLFQDNSLNVASVNGILNKLATYGLPNGRVNLTGGTNAAPTGQGLLDVAILDGLGWTVTIN